MKALLITMHRVTNYGSVLQTYALNRILQDIGLDVEILDYYPERQTVMGLMKRIGTKINQPIPVVLICRIVMIPSYFKRFLSFSRFRKKNLILTKKYRSREELEKDIPEADVYCTGSDQVWNYVESEGIDGAYYWSFLPSDKKRFSYAASIGLNELGKKESHEMKKYLEKFCWIGVREQNAVSIIENMGIRDAACVLDPVFLLDVNIWRGIADRSRLTNYMLVYNIHRSKKLDQAVRKIAGKMKLKVVYVGYSYHEKIKAGKYYCAPGVEKFLGLVDNASYVISDSFHATAFAILFNKQFSVFTPPKYSVRILDLLEQFHLENRIFTEETGFAFIDEWIDYQQINQKMESRKRESIGLLRAHLKEMTNDNM